MENYLHRIADDVLPLEMAATGGLLIVGPKWCGKTTSALRQAKDVIYMQDMETQEQNIALAKAKPSRFLDRAAPFLIDEWQIIPFIWDSIRFEVDRRGGACGQFILTGSAVPPDHSGIQHTGAGRIAKFIMRPMSLYESLDSTGDVSLAGLFRGDADVGAVCDKSIEDYAELTCRGGWPIVVGKKPVVARKMIANFFSTLVESDISRVDKKLRFPERARNILRSYARVTATAASYRTIRADIEVNDMMRPDTDTIADYVKALKKLYIIEDLPAWTPVLKDRTRLRTSEVRHLVDPSLACAALDVSPNDLMGDLKSFGFLFESLVVRDLRIYAQCLDGTVFHYLDHNGLEADAVVHLRDGRFGLLEVKLFDSEKIDEGAAHLHKLAAKLDSAKMRSPSFLAVITGTKTAYRRDDGVYVIPLGCLKP